MCFNPPNLWTHTDHTGQFMSKNDIDQELSVPNSFLPKTVVVPVAQCLPAFPPLPESQVDQADEFNAVVLLGTAS